MPLEPEPFLAYESSSRLEMPSSVSVIAIVGISLAAMTLLSRFFGIAAMVFLRKLTARAAMPPAMTMMSVVGGLVFLGLALVLLSASIGCLRRREWARVWLIRWAVVYPVALVIEAAVGLLVSIPMMSRTMTAAAATSNSSAPPVPVALILGISIVTQILSVLVLLILPVFILVYLRKPNVKAIFV